MKNYLFLIAIIFVLIFTGLFVSAQEDPFANLTYPIPELGNCQSRNGCEAFCEQTENALACLDYAQIHNLLPAKEIEMGRKMLSDKIAGPGGCQSKTECEAYCDDLNHIEECLFFALENNLIPANELKEAQKVAAAVKRGIKPPACRGKQECDIYCSQPEHMEECLTFAEAAGLIPANELAEAKKVLGAIKKGVKPPACRGKEECDVYCSQAEHFEECLLFAEAAGLIPAEELEGAKKALGAIRKGVKPPACRGEQECDIYCSQPEHFEECINFAEAAGFMTPEEATRARLTGGKGPGGCKGEEECRAFCEDPANMKECIEFAVKIGEMTPEEAAKALRGGPGSCRTEEQCQAYCEDPNHTEECIMFSVEQGFISPEEGEQMLQRFRMGGRGGPGGCQTDEECAAYCSDPAHFEECAGQPKPSEEPQELEEIPPAEEPQSFFDKVNQFLANITVLSEF